jgi:hypothetical protein
MKFEEKGGATKAHMKGAAFFAFDLFDPRSLIGGNQKGKSKAQLKLSQGTPQLSIVVFPASAAIHT